MLGVRSTAWNGFEHKRAFVLSSYHYGPHRSRTLLTKESQPVLKIVVLYRKKAPALQVQDEKQPMTHSVFVFSSVLGKLYAAMKHSLTL